VGVYIWPRVFHFAKLEQNWGYNFVNVRHQLKRDIIILTVLFVLTYPEERIFWKMFQSKLSLACVPGIGLSQHGMSITRHDLAGF